jgi:hypothetical protein
MRLIGFANGIERHLLIFRLCSRCLLHFLAFLARRKQSGEDLLRRRQSRIDGQRRSAGDLRSQPALRITRGRRQLARFSAQSKA